MHPRVLHLEDPERAGERLFVQRVARSRGDGGLHQGHPDLGDLCFQNAPANAVHADPVVVSGDGGQEGDDLHAGIGSERGEGEARVLAAAPRQRNGPIHSPAFAVATSS
jgi:hypothetical protein